MMKSRHPLVPVDDPAPHEHLPNRYVSCLTQVRGYYADLTDAERRFADYLLAQPGKAMFCSIMEAARESGVSVSTITRLCVKLGYTGFVELKTALGVDLLSPNHSSPTSIGAEDAPETVISKVFDLGIQSLKDTVLVLDANALARATAAIVACRRVECFGSGNLTGPIAEIFQHRLIKIGVPSAAYTDEWQASSASLLGPADVALGLSNSGTAQTVANALQVAREAGVTTIAITYAPHSPVAQAAAIVLVTATRETHEWADSVASRLPMLTVLDVLYACIALRKNRPTTH